MLGRKASLKALRAVLYRHRPTALRTTEFAQGALSKGITCSKSDAAGVQRCCMRHSVDGNDCRLWAGRFAIDLTLRPHPGLICTSE